MFPPTNFRMANLAQNYGGGAPDMSAAIPSMAAIQAITQMIQNERNQQYNRAQSEAARAKNTAAMQGSAAQAQATESAARPTNTVLGPDIPTTFEGMTPLQQKQIELQGKQIEAIKGYRQAQLTQGQEKIDVSKERTEGTLAQGQQKVDISKQRANAYSLRQNNMGSQIKADEDGNLWVIHPDGTTSVPRDPDTGNQLAVTSAAELQQMKNDGTINAITTRGEIQKDIQTQKDTAAGQRQAAKPTTPQGGYSQQATLAARAQEYVNANPDKKGLVTMQYDTTGRPTNFFVAPKRDAGMFGTAVTDQDRQGAMDWIYQGKGSSIGTGAKTTVTGTPAGVTTTTSGTTGPATGGRVTVYKGGKPAGTIPNTPDQLNLAKTQGLSLTAGGGNEDEEDNQ